MSSQSHPPEIRIGLFGGSFDPVHRMHLQMARAARAQAALERVLWIPSARTPLKAHQPMASDTDRLAMLRLALADEPGFEIDERELRKGGLSYTIKSVESLSSETPEATFFWIMGADQIAQLDQWHRAADLARHLVFLPVGRPGHANTEPPLPGLRTQWIELESDALSSSLIRERVARNAPISGMVSPSVEAFIYSNHLYKQEC